MQEALQPARRTLRSLRIWLPDLSLAAPTSVSKARPSAIWYEFRLNGGGSDGGSAGACGVPTGGEGDPLVDVAQYSVQRNSKFPIDVALFEPIQSLDGSISSAS